MVKDISGYIKLANKIVIKGDIHIYPISNHARGSKQRVEHNITAIAIITDANLGNRNSPRAKHLLINVLKL